MSFGDNHDPQPPQALLLVEGYERLDVMVVIWRCLKCQARKPSRHTARWPILSIPLPSGPDVAIGVDYFGPLLATPRGNTSYVTLFTGPFQSESGYMYPVSDEKCTSEGTVDMFVNKHMPLWGYPVSLYCRITVFNSAPPYDTPSPKMEDGVSATVQRLEVDRITGDQSVAQFSWWRNRRVVQQAVGHFSLHPSVHCCMHWLCCGYSRVGTRFSPPPPPPLPTFFVQLAMTSCPSFIWTFVHGLSWFLWCLTLINR